MTFHSDIQFARGLAGPVAAFRGTPKIGAIAFDAQDHAIRGRVISVSKYYVRFECGKRIKRENAAVSSMNGLSK